MLPTLFHRPEDWDGVSGEALHVVKVATSAVALLRAACRGLPRLRHHVLLQPYTGQVHVGLGKEATDAEALAWEDRFRRVGCADLTGGPLDAPPPGYGVEPWVWVKQAADPVVSFLAKALNYQPSAANKLIGGPSPLAATLASGAFGAGLGYLGGTAAEQLLPEQHFERGKLRRTLALAGAAVGAAPGAAWGLASQEGHPDGPGMRAWLSSWPFRPRDLEGNAHSKENHPVKRACELLLEQLPGLDPADFFEKESFQLTDSPLGQGMDLLGTLPMIQKDDFGRTVFRDPNTPLPVRAAAVGLVNVAANATGNSYVSPYDIARVAAGGAARGLIVGKTLGALAGLKPETQLQLQRAGTWGAVLSAVVPNAFPDASRIFPGH